MARNSNSNCTTPGCPDAAYCAGYCRRCYQYIHRWLKAGLPAIVARQERLALWEQRLSDVLGQAAPKVTRMKKKRAAR